MNEILALVLGVACAAGGGEFFVRAIVSLAHALRVPPGIVAATIAAFATSSPELSVAVNAALAGGPQIALGNALGANIVNVALVLGLAVLVSPIRSPRDSVKRDFPVALLAPLLTAGLLLDGTLSRVDGLVMFCVFAAWLAAALLEARRHRSSIEEVLGGQRPWVAVAHGAAGLALLAVAGSLIVYGARGLALSWGMDEFVVGATVVALGTTAPELATVIAAKLRGHDEVGLGTLLGSNIFNGLFIIPLAAAIHPIAVGRAESAVALGVGAAAIALTYPGGSGLIGRLRGALLLALYAVYVAALLQGWGGDRVVEERFFHDPGQMRA